MKRTRALHPFLFAAFPVLFLYSHNVEQVSATVIPLPLILILVGTVVLYAVFWLMLRNGLKAGLVTTLFIVLFFVYGHVADVVLGVKIGNLVIGRARYLLLFWALLFLAGSWRIIKVSSDLHGITGFLNKMSVVLIAIPLVFAVLSPPTIHVDVPAPPKPSKEIENPPNIYYIILDAYARADILKEYFDYDNSSFLKALRERGFYIAERSTSNYYWSHMSTASALNLMYLDEVVAQMSEKSKKNQSILEILRHNNAAKFLKQYGYQFVAFSTGCENLEISNADIYASAPLVLSEFQNLLLNMTAIPILLEKLTQYQYNAHRKRILYTFDYLPEMTKLETPVLVFAHIVAPHPPFVFGRNGEWIHNDHVWSMADADQFLEDRSLKTYIQGYTDQLTFINKKVLETVDNILELSDIPPVIILQADHGSRSQMVFDDLEKTDMKEAMSIFNAYHLPSDGDSLLYDNISPVNSFRVVFNHYFGASYPLLKDRCNASTLSQAFKFYDVTAKVVSQPVEQKTAHSRPDSAQITASQTMK